MKTLAILTTAATVYGMTKEEAMRARDRDQREGFIPPEKRFDFNRMNRVTVPKGDGHADIQYSMQTIETSRQQDEEAALKQKFMTPEELVEVHKKQLAEFEAGQDANLLDSARDMANVDIVIKSHRCDSCRLIANKMSMEFFDLEEKFSRFSRNLSESVIIDGIEEFCHKLNWENDGMTKAMLNKDGDLLDQPVWRLVGPEFETWDARGEVTATSQLWPVRFSKHCMALVNEYDEVDLYHFWQRITKGSENPATSDLDDMLCFAHEDADCNRYRNPSEYKQRPVVEEILEEYVEFESKITARKKKEHEAELAKVLKEHKRQIINAKKRQKEHAERLAAYEAKKAAEAANEAKKAADAASNKLKEEL